MKHLATIFLCLFFFSCSGNPAIDFKNSNNEAIFVLIENGGTIVPDEQDDALNTALHLFQQLTKLSPLLLLLGSLKAWHRSFTWRRIMTEKNISPKLSRGHHKPSRSNARPGILERGCLILFLMAIGAILKQLGMTNIPWLIGSIIGSLSLLRLAIRMVR